MCYIFYIFTLRCMFYPLFLCLFKYHKYWRHETMWLLRLSTGKERPLLAAASHSESPDFFLVYSTGHPYTGAQTQYKFLRLSPAVQPFPALKGQKKGFPSFICSSIMSAKWQGGKSDWESNQILSSENVKWTFGNHIVKPGKERRQVKVMLSSQTELVLLSKGL